MTTTRTNVRDRSSEHVDFGLRDEKGRAVGVRVQRYTCDWVAVEGNYGYNREPGTYFAAWVHVTRDGKEYGPCKGEEYSQTEEAREAYIAKRIKGARDRAAKKSNKGAAA